ncbi:hypothetical protein [Radiobacillus sp. PE A8.2]|uniref:hypothetical protein n=1 Tax=Radiobacillus sp. PE A8.2 TaxID=3380349 RepID=UPI00388DDBE5
MTYEEAIEVLQMLEDLFPKYVVTERKTAVLLPALKTMDYDGVMRNISNHYMESPHAPTLKEVAAYPSQANPHIDQMAKWQEEAKKVTPETKEKFRKAFQELLEKTKVK